MRSAFSFGAHSRVTPTSSATAGHTGGTMSPMSRSTGCRERAELKIDTLVMTAGHVSQSSDTTMTTTGAHARSINRGESGKSLEPPEIGVDERMGQLHGGFLLAASTASSTASRNGVQTPRNASSDDRPAGVMA